MSGTSDTGRGVLPDKSLIERYALAANRASSSAVCFRPAYSADIPGEPARMKLYGGRVCGIPRQGTAPLFGRRILARDAPGRKRRGAAAEVLARFSLLARRPPRIP